MAKVTLNMCNFVQKCIFCDILKRWPKLPQHRGNFGHSLFFKNLVNEKHYGKTDIINEFLDVFGLGIQKLI